MYAMELSGAHLGKVLRVTYKLRNKDGTVRNNAKQHEWYLLIKSVHHFDTGIIDFTGWWYKDHPIKPPYYWNAGQKLRLSYAGWRTDNAADPFSMPENLPYYAEVEVVDG